MGLNPFQGIPASGDDEDHFGAAGFLREHGRSSDRA